MDEHSLTDVLKTPALAEILGETASVKRKKRAQALRLLTSTITPDTLMRIGTNVLDEEPREMLREITEHYSAEQSPAGHEAFRARAESTRLRPK